MKNKLITLLSLRVEDEIGDRESLAVLKKYDVERYIDTCIITLYNHSKTTNEACYLAPTAASIGRRVIKKLKLGVDSALAARIGCFVLYSFEQLGVMSLVYGKSKYKNAAYSIKIKDADLLDHLWSTTYPGLGGILPSSQPYEDWETTKHENGTLLLKTQSSRMLREVTVERCPMLFEAVNKMQRTAYQVNRPVLEIALWAFKNKEEAFNEVWDESNKQAKTSKVRDTKAILTIAGKMKYFKFYHQFTFDFRCRIYATTGYFNSQGVDVAKGMIRRDEKKVIGPTGYKWLLIGAANSWAGSTDDGQKTDKLPLLDRAQWTLDNEEWIAACAFEPKVNKEWMAADKPWCFLAIIFELLKLRLHQRDGGSVESFESSLEVFIDGLVAVVKLCELLGRPERIISSEARPARVLNVQRLRYTRSLSV